MSRPVNAKCKHCATLSVEEAIALHGETGDGCWNPRDIQQRGYECHRRRHHYRHRAEINAEAKLRRRHQARLKNLEPEHTLSPPSFSLPYAAILILYRQHPNAPVHAVAAEVWQGDRPIAAIPAVHCMGMRSDDVSQYLHAMLALLRQSFPITRFEDVVKERPVHTCPIIPCPYTSSS
jgi:hypothetical protein